MYTVGNVLCDRSGAVVCICDSAESAKNELERLTTQFGGKAPAWFLKLKPASNQATEIQIAYSTEPKDRLKIMWQGILNRCKNGRAKGFKRYGARGIKVCKEWESFENFFEWAKGKWKLGLCIDRIDNDKNYTPSNCRFITKSENSMKGAKKMSELRKYLEIKKKIPKKYYQIETRKSQIENEENPEMGNYSQIGIVSK